MIDGAEPKVRVEREGHVLIITLNRPEVRNAVDGEVCDLVGNAVRDADADPEVRVIVITGAGTQSFCAGADLKALARGDRVMAEGEEKLKWSFAGFANNITDKPTIAAVNGTALGGGFELALACDMVVAEEHAIFGLPEVKRGLIAGAGGAFRILAQTSPKIAMEALLTGRSFDAAQAQAWGLVNRVVPTGSSRTAALDLGQEIAQNAPLAVQASKRLAYGLVDRTRPSEAFAWERTDAENLAIIQTEDAQEGPRAFAEKRQPVWLAR
ncbi:enoyl-CoA hydratase-related protein [Arthrobacter sp. W4I7]|uniref:enoyl-CoA hydratase-related protein n=1 Tax=Arthrobacter sp. W4I7 TaxID=3042296 RepID=UPI0027842AE6|nr:enoyl-CoA hydratase-related protein [Arthrobacter sp. W4I7]MDQ0691384.1 crotonobetainyl-CoA hydratase [Arthrobacter sp. W4I7]